MKHAIDLAGPGRVQLLLAFPGHRLLPGRNNCFGHVLIHNPVGQYRGKRRSNRSPGIRCHVMLSDSFARQPTQDLIDAACERGSVPRVLRNQLDQRRQRRPRGRLHVGLPSNESRELRLVANRPVHGITQCVGPAFVGHPRLEVDEFGLGEPHNCERSRVCLLRIEAGVQIVPELPNQLIVLRPDHQDERTSGRTDTGLQDAHDGPVVSCLVCRRRRLDQMEIHEKRTNALEMSAIESGFRIVDCAQTGRTERLKCVQDPRNVLCIVVDDNKSWRGEHHVSLSRGNTKASTAPSNSLGTSASPASGNARRPSPSSITRLA